MHALFGKKVVVTHGKLKHDSCNIDHLFKVLFGLD